MKIAITALALLMFVATAECHTHTKKELKPLLENRCYLSKSPADRAKWLKEMNDLSEADFAKTMKDLDAINAADRLLGTKGCEVGKQ